MTQYLMLMVHTFDEDGICRRRSKADGVVLAITEPDVVKLLNRATAFKSAQDRDVELCQLVFGVPDLLLCNRQDVESQLREMIPHGELFDERPAYLSCPKFIGTNARLVVERHALVFTGLHAGVGGERGMFRTEPLTVMRLLEIHAALLA